MSTEAISWVFRHSQSRGAARLVLLTIASHANPVGKSSWPSLRTIGKESGVSLRQLKRSLEKLVEIGELRLNWCGGPFGTNLYELPLLHSHLRKMEGASLHVTGCVLNKKKEEEHQLWKSAKPDWLSQQIAALAKEKAM